MRTPGEDFQRFDLEQVMKVVMYDLDNTYSRQGNNIMYQKEGCPIGGFLSSTYANISCGFDENEWIENQIKKGNEKKFYGARQVDDMIMVMTEDYEEEIYDSMKKAYTAGLTIEEQEVKKDNKLLHLEFIGLDIKISRRRGNVTVALQNVNMSKGMIQAGKEKQLKPRFSHWSDYRSIDMITKVMITMLHRCQDYTITRRGLEKSVTDISKEWILMLQYPKAFVVSTMKEFVRRKVKGRKRKEIWEDVVNNIEKGTI